MPFLLLDIFHWMLILEAKVDIAVEAIMRIEISAELCSAGFEWAQPHFFHLARERSPC